MNEWVKTLATSTVVAGVVSWLTTSYKIEQELRSRQSEAGYEELVKANTLSRQSKALMEEAKRGKDQALATQAQKLSRQSDASYSTAQQKIAAFGHEDVVKAISDYYSKYGRAATPCTDKEKVKSDTQIYKAIRNTLGVGGNTLGFGDSVSDEHLANLMFLCSLK